jgi:hypothetical protein
MVTDNYHSAPVERNDLMLIYLIEGMTTKKFKNKRAPPLSLATAFTGVDKVKKQRGLC